MQHYGAIMKNYGILVDYCDVRLVNCDITQEHLDATMGNFHNLTLVTMGHFEGTIEHRVVTIQPYGGRIENCDISMGIMMSQRGNLFHNES